MTTTQKTQQREEALASLTRNDGTRLEQGDTLHIITRHRSASGMARYLDVYLFKPVQVSDETVPVMDILGNGCVIARAHIKAVKLRLTYSVAKALGCTYDNRREAIRINGCGFSAAHEIAYELSKALFNSPDALGYEEL